VASSLVLQCSADIPARSTEGRNARVSDAPERVLFQCKDATAQHVDVSAAWSFSCFGHSHLESGHLISRLQFYRVWESKKLKIKFGDPWVADAVSVQRMHFFRTVINLEQLLFFVSVLRRWYIMTCIVACWFALVVFQCFNAGQGSQCRSISKRKQKLMIITKI